LDNKFSNFRERGAFVELKDLEIIRVRIPLPFRLNHVNCYLAKGAEGWTILDAGLGYDMTRETWKKTFTEHGLKPTDIKQIYLTHYHPDHYGFCGELQQWTGAKVYMSRRSYEQAQTMWTEERFVNAKQNYIRSGIPEPVAEQIDVMGRRFSGWVRPHATADHWIEEGDTFQFGALTYEAVHTPGHADGHMCLINKAEKVWIAADHLLAKITPNITYTIKGKGDPLKDYLNSLRRIKDFDLDYVIPGHGSTFTDVTKRINEVLDHHDKRLSLVMESVKGNGSDSSTGGKDAYQVCQDLFSKQLNEHEIRFAIGETLAHLQYLVNEGEIQQEEVEGILYFS
jgi:glyoxylase-like metal-dependent hydrolase (beta-lactamase superfamily II)